MKLIQIQEFEKIDDGIIEQDVKPLNLIFTKAENEIKFLNLDYNYKASYYIGLDWLSEKKQLSLLVKPKIDDLDYLKMFMECFKHQEVSKILPKIYKIYFNKNAITIKSNPFELTPLLIIHFLNRVKEIVKKGLKKDYIRVEENLQSKIKGKVLFNQSLKKNNFKGRFDRNYCNYQEYSINCFENQIIKKTLRFIQVYLNKYYKNKSELNKILNYCFSAFIKVDDIENVHKIKQFKINPLYKEYAEILKLAKLILKQFSYSVSSINTNFENKLPPFYIDMSLLFELYVYTKLIDEYGKTIKYQKQGNYGNVDFVKIDQNLIIDTKYKTYYKNNFNDNSDWKRHSIAKDIRQLSGYSRDKKITQNFNLSENNKLFDCVIIYPNKMNKSNFNQRFLKEKEINEFYNFYKIGIKLPLISERKNK